MGVVQADQLSTHRVSRVGDAQVHTQATVLALGRQDADVGCGCPTDRDPTGPARQPDQVRIVGVDDGETVGG